jgi:hypothetical protein
MVLNILMRWPALIVVLFVGGSGAALYGQYGHLAFPEAPRTEAAAPEQPSSLREVLTREQPRLEQGTMSVARHRKNAGARK